MAYLLTLPTFPRTPHLPINTSLISKDDIVATDDAFELISNSKYISFQEKLDGANLRIKFDGVSEPIIGNREHILNKAYIKKDTPAKLQFRSVWNWVYENKNKFKKLTKLIDETPVVFGEWLFAQHTIKYDLLPSYFIAYDIFIDNKFIDPVSTIKLLAEADFCVPPTIEITSDLKNVNDILKVRSSFSSTDIMEGIYIKAGNENEIKYRYKILRDDFISVNNFNDRGLIKNSLYKR